MTNDPPRIPRRTALAGAAWAAPAVAFAVAAPSAAASTVPDADYYWATEEGISLEPVGGRQAELSTQIAFRGSTVPADATFVLTVLFDSEIALARPAGWDVSEPLTGTTFTLSQPAGLDPNVTLSIEFGNVSGLVATATMSLLDGDGTTWAQEPAISAFAFL
jgi:hypothetical protein